MESLPNEIILLIAGKLQLKDRARWGLCGREINAILYHEYRHIFTHASKSKHIFANICNLKYTIRTHSVTYSNEEFSLDVSLYKTNKIKCYMQVYCGTNKITMDNLGFMSYLYDYTKGAHVISVKPFNNTDYVFKTYSYCYIMNELFIDEYLPYFKARISVQPLLNANNIHRTLSKITKNHYYY